jgi:hypothetical protein
MVGHFGMTYFSGILLFGDLSPTLSGDIVSSTWLFEEFFPILKHSPSLSYSTTLDMINSHETTGIVVLAYYQYRTY